MKGWDGKVQGFAGDFTTFNGFPRRGFVRVTPDGSVDMSFDQGSGPNNPVAAAAAQRDGKTIIGGSFTSYNGTPRSYIARLMANGSVDSSFNVVANNEVKTIALQPDGRVIIGGLFTTINGVPRTCLARLNADGTLDMTFNPGSGLANSHNPGFVRVNAVALQWDGKVLLGGIFTSYDNTSRTGIARLKTDGSLDPTFDSTLGATVSSGDALIPGSVATIAIQQDGKIFIGGYFTQYNGTSRKSFARLGSDGSLDSSFSGVGPDSDLLACAIQTDGKILIAGYFTRYNGVPRNHIARINSDGSVDFSFNGGANDWVGAIALQPDGKIVMGGGFTSYDGLSRIRVARLCSSAAPYIVTTNVAVATVGQPFTYQIAATNKPTSYNATNLPVGLSFDSALNVIKGVPTAAGTTSVTLTAGNPYGVGNATLNLTVNPAPPANSPVITSGSSTTARTNTPFNFQVTARGVTSAATVTALDLPADLTINPGTGRITGTPKADGSYQVTLKLKDGAATATATLQLTFTSNPDFPVITSPAQAALAAGQPFSYQITAPTKNPSGPTTYSLSGTLPRGLSFDPITGIISGSYNPSSQKLAASDGLLGTEDSSALVGVTLYATNSEGTATFSLSFVPPPPTEAANISTRAAVGTGDSVLIGGFIVTGNAPKQVMLRAIAPSLSVNGAPLAGALQDPTLALYDSTGALIQQNDDWASDQEEEIVASTIPPTDSRESAILRTLDPGYYTAIVGGKGSETGIAVVELYALPSLDLSNGAQLAQISTRGNVQTNDNVLIGGFIITGNTPANVLVRGIGPELTAANVPNALQDPTLELHDGNGGVLAFNDNWETDQKQAIIDTTVPPKDSREPAILRSLAPGNYTAIVRGKDNSVGVALVEVYVLN